MDYHSFKSARQTKRNNDNNIKNNILKQAKKLALTYYTPDNTLNKLTNPFESVRKEEFNQLIKDYMQYQYINISNRKYTIKRSWTYQNAKIIMDYDFSLK